MSLPTNVIIDDSDPIIVYEEGKWVTDTSSLNYTLTGRPFNNTAHVTFQNASFNISFQGSLIQLWGLSSPSAIWNGTTNGHPIDLLSSLFGGSTVPGEQPHFRFSARFFPKEWEQGLINNLTVTVTGTEDNPVALDFARFVPSRLAKLEDLTVGVLEYSVSHEFTLDVAPPGWDRSDFLSTTTPDAPYTFNFTGTSVAGLGGNGVNDSHIQAMASYSIDGDDPVNFTVNNLATSVLDTITEQTIFRTNEVPPGDRTVQIVYHGDSTTTPLSMFSLLVTGTQTVLSVDPPPPAQPPLTSPSTPSLRSKSSHSATPSKIIAVTVAIIAIALLGFVGSLIYRRRKRRHKSELFYSDSLDPGPVAMAIVPFFDYPGEVTEKNTPSVPRESQAQAERVQAQQAGRVVTPMHQDRGIVPIQPVEEVVVVDIPPAYTSLGGQAQREDRRGEVAHLRKCVQTMTHT